MINKSINDSDALVVFRVGPVYCCAPTMAVISIIMPPEFTALPGATISEPGIFKSSHGLVHVVDLRKRFGVDEENRDTVGRIIVAEVESGRDGFWVDEIVDIVQFPMKGWGVVPVYIPRDVFLKTLMLDGVIHLYTDFDCLHKLKTNGFLRAYIENINREHSGATKEKKNNISLVVQSGVHEHGPEVGAADDAGVAMGEHLNANEQIHRQDVKNRHVKVIKTVSAEKEAEIMSPSGKAMSSSRISYSKQEVSSGPDVPVNVKLDDRDDSSGVTINDDAPVLSGYDDRRSKYVYTDIDEKNDVYLFVFAILSICIVAVLLFFNFPDFNLEYEAKEGVQSRAKKLSSTQVGQELVVESSAEELARGGYSEAGEVLSNDAGESGYAELKKDNEGIVIIVNEGVIADESIVYHEAMAPANDAPNTSDVLTDKSNTKNITLEQDVIEEAPLVMPVKIDKAVIKSPDDTKIIVHVVKKGDTLWHIALKYIKNPYRYPELARLSKIKNPDRIYPGDRVKIIIKKRSGR
ncbi:MAG: chemotaxis protein CheW [Gammaproteobacteria bacterium]|nr:chemotaxis protein CheW [Gammaproteobacteria bacterium]